MDEFLGFVFVVFMVGLCVNECFIKPKKNKEKLTDNSEKKQDWVKRNNISTNIKYVYTNSFNTICCEYLVDKMNKRVVVSDTASSYTTIPFSEIIGCEILVNSHSGGGVGGAVVGGVLAGETGAIIGAIAGKKISSYNVVIYKKNINQPQFKFSLTKDTLSSDHSDIIKANEFAQNVVASVKAILSSQQNNNILQTPIDTINNNEVKKSTNVLNQATDKAQLTHKSTLNDSVGEKDKLLKLKDLLENDLITQEEYDEKRKDILNSL